MTKALLEVKNLSKIFPSMTEYVLKGINLKIEKGDFVSVLGASGSGKSTLLTILGGMDTATEGEVLLDGVDITKLKEKELAKLRRTKIGFVFQFFNLAPYLTVEENIILPMILERKTQKEYAEKLKYYLDYLKLSDLAKKLPGKLSGGEQQRVAIARGLIYQPEIIFLDEPTGNLDSKTAIEIMELLQRINKEFNTTIMQVTHSETNASFGNKIIRIQDGNIIEEIVKDNDA
ncbi:MAG: ABC transporter ATP-binding protein [Clostridiales bacterium]|nr:ABC transporter ATP-binding protein [Clostridiales bacterium]